MEDSNKKKSIICPECGGDFTIEDLLDGDDILTCINCGKKFAASKILDKSDSVRISEIYANMYRDIEITKANEHIAKEKVKYDAEFKKMEFAHHEKLLQEKQNERKRLVRQICRVLIGILSIVTTILLLYLAITFLKTLPWNALKWIIGIISGLVLSSGCIILAVVKNLKGIDWLDVLPNLLMFVTVIVNFILICKFNQNYKTIFNLVELIAFITVIIVRRIQNNSLTSFSSFWRVITFLLILLFLIIGNIVGCIG